MKDWRKMTIDEIIELGVSAQNDMFRKTFDRYWGIVVLTHDVCLLEPQKKQAVSKAVRLYDKFDDANNPYGEHDFGGVEVWGDNFFWKIDYYDNKLQCHARQKHIPTNTRRVLTIMYQHEW